MIYLTFDIEEFDTPLEFGGTITTEEQFTISSEGATVILNLLQHYQIKATFFVTANYALHCGDIVKRMVEEGHEIASHAFYHSHCHTEDLLQSKITLQKITDKEIVGFRSPRLSKIDYQALQQAGYLYDSSINPTYLPGRYNYFSQPKIPFYIDEILEIPTSVATIFRMPLFWLSFHNFPLSILLLWTNNALHYQRYLNLYFHPWEFTDTLYNPQYKLPFYIKKNSGYILQKRLEQLIIYYQQKNIKFTTLSAMLH